MPGDRPGAADQLGRHELIDQPCQRDRLAGLAQSLLDVTADPDLPEALRRVVAAGRQLTGARDGTLAVGDGSRAHVDERVGGRDVLDVPICLQDKVFGTLHLAHKADEMPFTAEDEFLVRGLAAVAGVVVERARLHEQSEGQRRRLAALHDVGTALLARADPRRALQIVADRALELTGADQAFLAMPVDPDEPTEDVEELEIAVASGPESAQVMGCLLPVLRSSTGRAFRRNEPCRSDRLAYAPFDRALEVFGPALIVPLRASDGVTGVLVTLRRRGRPSFDSDQLALVTAFADQAALALRLAAAQRESHELMLLADRDRIARDLHDHVIQRLFGAGLSLHGTMDRVASPEARARIDATIDELQEVVADIRAAIFDLHDGGLDPRTVGQRLRRAVADLTMDASVETEVHLRGRLSGLSPVLADHLDAVVREAVSNAVRHSGADTIRVGVDASDRVTVEVVDDGHGGGTPRPYGGLDNLAARAEEVGGTFEVASAGEHGTRVVWSAPVRD